MFTIHIYIPWFVFDFFSQTFRLLIHILLAYYSWVNEWFKTYKSYPRVPHTCIHFLVFLYFIWTYSLDSCAVLFVHSSVFHAYIPSIAAHLLFIHAFDSSTVSRLLFIYIFDSHIVSQMFFIYPFLVFIYEFQ